jgi:hypothetical protein
MSCVNHKDCPTIRPNLTPFASIEIHLALPSAAGVWHARGMADWKIGDKVISIADGHLMKKNVKGEITHRYETFFNIEFTISYVDFFNNPGTMRVNQDDMERLVKKI